MRQVIISLFPDWKHNWWAGPNKICWFYDTRQCCGDEEEVVISPEEAAEARRNSRKATAIHHLAERKARKLLLRHLNSEQQQQFRKDSTFWIKVKNRYYHVGKRGFVKAYRKREDKEPIFGACIHTSKSSIPLSDEKLATKVMLQANEKQFLHIANVTYVKPSLSNFNSCVMWVRRLVEKNQMLMTLYYSYGIEWRNGIPRPTITKMLLLNNTEWLRWTMLRILTKIFRDDEAHAFRCEIEELLNEAKSKAHQEEIINIVNKGGIQTQTITDILDTFPTEVDAFPLLVGRTIRTFPCMPATI